MSLNIKSERAVALVRELAARTGSSQTSAVEDAVARRLAELDSAATVQASRRRAEADEILRILDGLLTSADIKAIRRNDAELYDESGLPR